MNYFQNLIVSIIFIFPIAGFAQQVPAKYKDHGFYAYADQKVDFDIIVFEQKNNFKISKKQYQHFSDFVDASKTWIYQRWGMKDIRFSQRCQVQFALGDEVYKDLYKKLNRLPHYKNNDKKEAAVFISLNSDDVQFIESRIREDISLICIREFESAHNIQIPNWIVQGMCLLNANPQYIKDKLKVELVDPKLNYTNLGMSLNDLISLDYEEFKSLDYDKRTHYRSQCAALLLMFQKELIKDKTSNNLIKLFHNKTFEEIVRQAGFEDLNKFEFKFKNYFYNLNYDIINGKSPNSYFTWFIK